LTWTLAELARNPGETAKIRAEVAAVLGEREPTFEDLPKLVHVERVIQESMRLYPPAWCMERAAREDDELGGYSVPKGTTIVIAPYTLHRHPKHWERPEAFDPMRFAERPAAQRPAYLPFGDGPRVCIGRAFAMMEAKIALAMIARDLDVALLSKTPIGLDAAITLRPKGAVPARLSARAPLAS
jgi:cytochrome P450